MERIKRGPYRVTGTAKQRRYLTGLTSGLSKRQAAKAAGYKGKPSLVVADLEKAAFNRAIYEAFEAAGVTLETIAAKIGDLMKATEEKAFVTRSGEVVYAEAADLADVQLKATVLAANLLGISSRARQVVAEAEKPRGDGVSILILAQQFEHLSDEQLEEAMQLMRVGQFEGSRFAQQATDATLPNSVTVNGEVNLI